MKSILSRFFLFIFSLFVSLAISASAFAACPGTPTASLGIHSGSASSLAGLIVHTKNNGVDSNMSVTISESSSAGQGIALVNSSYAIASTSASGTWNSGSTYYIASQSTQCSNPGWLWLGYGASTAYGNKYALDCKYSSTGYFTYTVAVVPPSGDGHWDYSVTGTVHSGAIGSTALAPGDNNITFQAANGYTGVVTFNWVPAPPPVINYSLAVGVSPAGVATATGGGSYTSGSTATAGYNGLIANYNSPVWSGDCSGTATTVSVAMNGNKACTVTFNYTPPLPKTLTCVVNPVAGPTPHVVRVNTTPGNLTSSVFTYYMDDPAFPAPYANQSTEFFHTYETSGLYHVEVSNSDYNGGARVPCNPAEVNVTDPSDEEGGEVNPN